MGIRAVESLAWSVGAFDVSEDPARAVRIFRAGVNDSTQGPVLFDETAAKLVMESFAARAIDGMIDLEHLSLDDGSPSFDPDARGYYQLEIRRDANGGAELWMLPRWNAEGEARIREKRQRYVSPFFAWKLTEDGQRRVTSVRNVGLVANPATHGAQPLIAASARKSRRTIPGRGPATKGTIAMADDIESQGPQGMTTERLSTMMEALGLPADAPITELVALLRSTLMELEGSPTPTAETPEMEEASADPAADPAKVEEDKPAVMAATARLLRLADRGTVSQAMEQVEAWRQSHMKLAEGEKKLAAERAAMEATERRGLAVELVKLGAELPATVWANPTAPAGSQKLSARIVAEPIGELRSRVAAWRSAKRTGSGAARPPAADADGGVSALSARELQMCADLKVDPKVYAADKLARLAKKAG